MLSKIHVGMVNDTRGTRLLLLKTREHGVLLIYLKGKKQSVVNGFTGLNIMQMEQLNVTNHDFWLLVMVKLKAKTIMKPSLRWQNFPFVVFFELWLQKIERSIKWTFIIFFSRGFGRRGVYEIAT